MRVGFTGSRHRITPAQVGAVASRLRMLRDVYGADEFHHGDCVEADAAAAAVARELGLRVVAHPPTNPRFRAWFPSDEERAPLPYLDRDRAIVEAVAVLIACPRTWVEEQRSGTWFTVRRARRRRIGRMVIGPDGALVEAYKPEEFACT